MYLQSYVTPVVAYSEDRVGATVKRIFGTSFIIDGNGTGYGGSISMTAAHVLRSAMQFCEGKDFQIGIVGKADDGKEMGSVVAPILAAESAPGASDIAVFISRYRAETFLKLAKEMPDVWKDVATIGYPDEAVSGDAENLRLNLRAQKGFIQRMLKPGDLLHLPDLSGFELSFLLAGGMSGSPVFVHSREADLVVGVSVGTFGSETMISEITEVQQDGTKYREVQNSLNRYGVAESVIGLASWAPKFLAGVTLGEFLEGKRAKAEQLFFLGMQRQAFNLDG